MVLLRATIAVTLRILFGRKVELRNSAESQKPARRQMRCLTPWIQERSSDPDFCVEMITEQPDGWLRFETYYPHDGRTEVRLVSPVDDAR